MAKKTSQNKQRVFLWFGLIALGLGLLVLTVFAVTGGTREQSSAQTTFTFTEDFSTTTYQDLSTTADWDTSDGEASLFHGEWTNIQDHSIPGQKALPPNTYAQNPGTVTVNVEIGPDNQPHLFIVSIEFPNSTYWYTHWDPDFYGPNQGAWLKGDNTPGADHLAPGFLSVQASGAHRSWLMFDSNNLPVVAFWDRPIMFGNPVRPYAMRYCSSTTPLPTATIFDQFGNMDCTAAVPHDASTNPSTTCLTDAAMDSQDSLHFLTAYCGSAPLVAATDEYTRWDPVTNAWVKLAVPSVPGADIIVSADQTISEVLIAAFLAVDSNDVVHIGYRNAATTAAPKEFRGIKGDPYGAGIFTALDGTPGYTIVKSWPSGSVNSISMAQNPVTDLPHFSWTVTGSFFDTNFEQTAWDGLQFVKIDGTPGMDAFSLDGILVAAGGTSSWVFDPSRPRGEPSIIFRTASGPLLTYFGRWDGTSFSSHEDKALPEPMPVVGSGGGFSPFFSLAIDSEGIAYAARGKAGSDPEIGIVRWTEEFADVTRDVLASTAVDAIADPILTATLTVTGESRGRAGTDGLAVPVPLNQEGRNQFVDVDCFMANNGTDYFPITIGQEFTFPTVGSRLQWKCEMDSATLLDRPVLDTLSIAYQIAPKVPNLSLSKVLDTDGDGVFSDDGQGVKPGQVLSYQLQVANSGEEAANNVVLTDEMPVGTTYIPGTTKINGAPVADVNGQSPLVSGLPLGDILGGTLTQTDWSGGPGQTLFTDSIKFEQSSGVNFKVPEILRIPTEPLWVDEAFAFPNSSTVTSSGNVRGGLDSVVALADGRVFTVWTLISGEIRGRFLDANGNALTGEILLSSAAPPIANLRPAARQLPNGEIVVVWQTGSFGTPQKIVMRRIDLNGALLTGEVVLASEPFVFFPAGFIGLDTQATFGLAGTSKSPLAVDAAGDIYVSFMRSDATAGCRGAFVAKFDSAGNPLWPGVPHPEVQVDAGGCTVSRAPSIAVNGLGQVQAVFQEGLSAFGPFDLITTTLSSAGAIVSPPTTIIPSAGLSLASLARAPGSSTEVLAMLINGDPGCGIVCLVRVNNTGSITGTASLGSATSFSPDVAVDHTDGRIFVSWSDAISGHVTQMLDVNLVPLSGEVVSPIFGISLSNSYIDVDDATNSVYADWLEGVPFFGLDMHVGKLQYEPIPHQLSSSVFDGVVASTWQTMIGHATVPPGTSLAIDVRTGDTSTPDGSWALFTNIPYGLNGTLMTGTIPSTLSPHRYMQYRVTMEHTNVSLTPELFDIAFNRTALFNVTYQVQVTGQAGTIINNDAIASASNAPTATASNTTQNSILPASTIVIGGDDRIETSIDLSQHLFPQNQTADCVLVARADEPIDALPGSPLASACNGSILLTPTHNLDSTVLTEIKRLIAPGEPVYLLGQEAALDPAAIEPALQTAGFTNLKRVGDRERRGTSVKIARELDLYEPQPFTKAILANGNTFVDALSASSFASIRDLGGARKPLLLVEPEQLSAEVKDFLSATPTITTIYEIGGLTVLGQTLDKEAKALPQKPQTERIAGADRFVTTTLVADRFFPIPVTTFVMSGFGIPARTPQGALLPGTASVPIDALLAGPAAAAKNAPIIFVRPDRLPTPVRNCFENHDKTIGQVYFIGGDQVIHPSVRQAIIDLLK